MAAATATSTIFILAAALGLQAVERIAQRSMLDSLSGALDSAPSALAFFDADQELVFWNAPYAKLMAPYGVQIQRGLEMAALGRALERTEALTTWAGGAPLTPETLRRMRDSGTFVTSAGRAFRMDVGSPPSGGIIAVIHEVTAQHPAAEAVARARDAAEAASRAKSEFLANMSHEVRTPLNAVLGMAQVMSLHSLDEDQTERLSVIRESGAALLTLLDDVLDISKIEAGRLGLDIADFDLCARFRSACAPFAIEAAAKRLDFDLHVEPGLEGGWRGDGARIAQIISNLVSNAVKFTDSGEVSVIAERAESGVRITVRDTGIGMDEDQLAHVFDAFSQGDASATRRFGGAGLELAMASRLAGLMGAPLSATSRPAEGSVFILELPLERAPQAAATAADTQAIEEERPMRILAAEDNATNRRVLAALMAPLGVELTLACDGMEALEAFTTAAYDLVLMDIQMPVLSGLEAARAMRNLEDQRGGPRTPIVAVTANVMSYQIEEYLAAGMDAVVPKPLQADALLQAILRAAEPPSLVAA
ncbi:MAG TPA: ATP-binding protein [Phenylobacterium sp.]|nr:ATP-binding protein [Phenylobacterium sp.]